MKKKRYLQLKPVIKRSDFIAFNYHGKPHKALVTSFHWPISLLALESSSGIEFKKFSTAQISKLKVIKPF